MKNKLLTKLLLLPVLLLMGSSAYAQLTVSGTVSDATGPVPGVNIIVKGTSNGAQSDFDGNYTLNDVANDAVLVFSYLGYTTQEISVGGQSTINVTLQEDIESLGEVVVIGYGTTTVKDATGAVSAVTSDDFNQGVISSPEQLIQGKTAGVQITQTSGEPGAGVAFRIRGSNSIRSNNNPLFVVDGVPLAGDGTAAAPGDIAFGGGAARNPLNFLNPNDIESINILKDASATAIYGSRGANGVVIIKTKSGRGNRGGLFEVSTNLSISKARENYDLLDGPAYLDAITQFGGDANALNFRSNTDWQDVILRTAASVNTNVSYSQSYAQGNIRGTFGYGKQFGVVENSDQERITGRINAQHRFLKDKLTLGLQGSVSRVNDQAPPLSATAGFNGDLIGAAYLANPTWPNRPGFDPGGGALNPANLLENYRSFTNTNRYLVNLSADYQFIPELSAKVSIGYDKSEGETLAIFNGGVNGINRVQDNGQGAFNTLDSENQLMEITANYKKDFGNVSLDFIAGYSYQEFAREGFNSQGWGFGNDLLSEQEGSLKNTFDEVVSALGGAQQAGFDQNGSFINTLLPEIDDTAELPFGTFRGVNSFWVDSFDNADELQSFFGRAVVSISDKYLFTATMRADGSSRFGPDNQYGYFPSGSFAWKMAEEGFLGESVSTFKLRVGAGIVGNQDGLGYANYVLRQRFAAPIIDNDGSINRPGTIFVSNDNPDLKWEQTLDLNVGLDFGFGDDRFSGSLDVYRKETSDLLFFSQQAAPAVPPFFVFQNLEDGTVVNQGVELGLSYDFVDTEDFTIGASFNISYNDNIVEDTNRIADIGIVRGAGLTNAFAQRLAADQPLFSFYMAEFTGLDADGLPTYADVDGDGVGDPALDKKFVGKDALPDINTGLSLDMRYKNLDFNASFAGQFGFYVYNATANAFFTSGSITTSRNVITDVVTSGEAPGTSAEVSTRYLEKGDFIRLQSASIGYNFPLKDSSLFKSFRLSVSGQNLFLITDYSGLDPEVTVNTGDFGDGIPSAGIDYASFPRPRTFSFGVNATF
ncbi:SusC/RagA family TonB-linked outer membrane protein [Aureisphaera sp.]